MAKVTITSVEITQTLNIFYCEDCQCTAEHGGSKMDCPNCNEPMETTGFVEDKQT